MIVNMPSLRIESPPDTQLFDLTGLGLPEVPLVGHYQFRRARNALRPHRHDGCMEIVLLARGRQVYRVDGQDYVLGPGHLFVAWPDEPHGTGAWPQEPGTLYWIQVRLVPPGRCLLGLSRALSGDLAQALRSLPRRHFAAAGETEAQFEALVAGCRAPGPLGRLRIASSIVEILLGVVDAAAAAVEDRSTPRIQRAIEAIDRRLGEPIRLADLAAEVGLSLPWLKARFRREVGLAPGQYILRRRVDRAVSLLRAGGCSVTEAACAAGFASSQHLATAIRRFTGRRPSDFKPDA